MCYSLGASVTAGTFLCAAGAATLALARRRAQLPLASVPLLFGLQQLTEGVVWWAVDHDDARLDASASTAYMVFSHVWWPVFVPFAMLCLEVVRWRRSALLVALAVGALVSLDGVSMVLGSHGPARVQGRSLQYAMPSLPLIALYLLATCVGTLLSSHRFLRAVGAAALVLGLLTLWLYAAVFVSVWCFFCAVLAVLIFVWFWSLRRDPRAAPVA